MKGMFVSVEELLNTVPYEHYSDGSQQQAHYLRERSCTLASKDSYNSV
jgi:hypothetical protein